MPAPLLVLIDDSVEDAIALKRFFGAIGFSQSITHLQSAEESLVQLSSRALRPSLILLDLNLPGLDGRGFLVKCKQSAQLRPIPVVILTTSSNPADVDFCYLNGAAGFLVKTMDLEAQLRGLQALIDYWFTANVLPSPARLP